MSSSVGEMFRFKPLEQVKSLQKSEKFEETTVAPNWQPIALTATIGQ